VWMTDALSICPLFWVSQLLSIMVWHKLWQWIKQNKWQDRKWRQVDQHLRSLGSTPNIRSFWWFMLFHQPS
jgi:hypothetical protein